MSKEQEYDFDKALEESGLLKGMELPNPENPGAVAETLIRTWEGNRKSWRGDFYTYAGSYWRRDDSSDVLKEINTILLNSITRIYKDGKERTVPWSPNPGRLNAVMQQLTLQTALPSTEEPVRGGEYVFLENGRLVPMTMSLLPHDRNIFNTHACPYQYDPEAACPQFDTFLDQTFGSDPVRTEIHLRWMAYELLGAVDLQKAYYLLGERRSGKGTLFRISGALIGRGQVTAMSLSDFSKDFGMQALLGKSLCQIGDARDAGAGAGAAVERILGIVGGDEVQVNIKREKPWVGQLGVRFALASNNEIRLPDDSGTVVSRFIFNRTSGSHEGHEDFTLSHRIIEAEMPGVLNRVLPYVDRLYDPWPVSDLVLSTVKAMREASQPLRVWMEDCGVEVDPCLTMPRADAYSSYVSWAHLNGYRPMSNNAYGRALRACVPTMGDAQLGGKGSQVRTYTGLGFRE